MGNSVQVVEGMQPFATCPTNFHHVVVADQVSNYAVELSFGLGPSIVSDLHYCIWACWGSTHLINKLNTSSVFFFNLKNSFLFLLFFFLPFDCNILFHIGNDRFRDKI